MSSRYAWSGQSCSAGTCLRLCGLRMVPVRQGTLAVQFLLRQLTMRLHFASCSGLDQHQTRSGASPGNVLALMAFTSSAVDLADREGCGPLPAVEGCACLTLKQLEVTAWTHAGDRNWVCMSRSSCYRRLRRTLGRQLDYLLSHGARSGVHSRPPASTYWLKTCLARYTRRRGGVTGWHQAAKRVRGGKTAC